MSLLLWWWWSVPSFSHTFILSWCHVCFLFDFCGWIYNKVTCEWSAVQQLNVKSQVVQLSDALLWVCPQLYYHPMVEGLTGHVEAGKRQRTTNVHETGTSPGCPNSKITDKKYSSSFRFWKSVAARRKTFNSQVKYLFLLWNSFTKTIKNKAKDLWR